MPNKRKYDETFLREFRRLADSGLSLNRTAEHLGLTKNAAKYVAESYKVQFHSAPGPLPPFTLSEDQDLRPIVERERRIKQLEDDNSALRRKYEEALRGQTLAQQLVNAALPAITALDRVAPPPMPRPTDEHKWTQDAVCLMSCLHNGEVVESDATMNLGVYNPELAAARYEFYIEKVVDLALNHHSGERFERIWLVDLGDNASGAIHDELKETNAYPLGEQLVRTARLLSLGVRDLATHFPEVVVVGTVGNHPRFTKLPIFKNKVQDNGDWVIYKFMEAMLADQPNVRFIIPDAPWATVDIRGHNFFFAHGDTIKMYFKFPYYDAKHFVTEIAQLLVANKQPYPEYWGFGHFHQFNLSQLTYGEWLFTGSFKGPDEYSIGKLRAGTPPTQLFFGVHPTRGVSFRYPIVLTDADPAVQTRYLR